MLMNISSSTLATATNDPHANHMHHHNHDIGNDTIVTSTKTPLIMDHSNHDSMSHHSMLVNIYDNYFISCF